MLSLLFAFPAAKPNLQCAPLKDIALDTSSFLQQFPNVGSPDACCQLCGDNKACTAFTIDKNSTCFALKNIAGAAPGPGLFSGYTQSALTHYGE